MLPHCPCRLAALAALPPLPPRGHFGDCRPAAIAAPAGGTPSWYARAHSVGPLALMAWAPSGSLALQQAPRLRIGSWNVGVNDTAWDAYLRNTTGAHAQRRRAGAQSPRAGAQSPASARQWPCCPMLWPPVRPCSHGCPWQRSCRCPRISVNPALPHACLFLAWPVPAGECVERILGALKQLLEEPEARLGGRGFAVGGGFALGGGGGRLDQSPTEFARVANHRRPSCLPRSGVCTATP